MLHHKTLKELAQGLKNREYSSVELTDYFLGRIKKIDKNLNSFITVAEEVAHQQAALADKKLAQKGTDSSTTHLTGIPIAHKDIFCTQNIKTSCGSKMLDNFIPPYNATIVEKLTDAGCVLLGKTNMDEFAMGSSTEHSYYGATKNPWDLQAAPGGSSGGSAAAVAARLVPIATGSDTGGSIRQPTAFCGVTGLKPTYGLASRYGMIAFASSLDQAGILALSSEDAAMLLTFMAGFDSKDSTSADIAIPNYTKTLNNPLHGLKIGVPKEYFSIDLNRQIAQTLEEAMKTLKKLGASLVTITLPRLHLAIPTYHIISSAECSSNLARYDGVRYGYRCPTPKDWHDLYFRSRSESFGAEVKRRIMTGTYVLSTGFYEDFYLQAQKVRSLIKADFDSALKEVDIIISPTTPTTAFKLGEKISDPVNMYLSDMYTAPASLCGLPAISIPVGFMQGLPIGMQLIGNYFGETKLLNAAHQYQQATDWHKKMPKCCSE